MISNLRTIFGVVFAVCALMLAASCRASLEEKWRQTISGSVQNTMLSPTVCESDSAGNLYVLAMGHPHLGTSPITGVLVKLAPNGTTIWCRAILRRATPGDYKLLVAPNGNPYVVWLDDQNSAGNRTLAFMALDGATGATKWVRVDSGPTVNWHFDSIFLGNDRLVVTGLDTSPFVQCRSLVDGSILWTNYENTISATYDIASDDASTIWAADEKQFGLTSVQIRKIDGLTGVTLQTVPIVDSSPQQISPLVHVGSGRVLFAYTRLGTSTIGYCLFDLSGVLQFQSTLTAATNQNQVYVNRIRPVGTDVAMLYFGDSGGVTYDLRLARINLNSGSVLWDKVLPISTNPRRHFSTIVDDAAFVSYRLDGSYLAALDLSSGNLLWQQAPARPTLCPSIYQGSIPIVNTVSNNGFLENRVTIDGSLIGSSPLSFLQDVNDVANVVCLTNGDTIAFESSPPNRYMRRISADGVVLWSTSISSSAFPKVIQGQSSQSGNLLRFAIGASEIAYVGNDSMVHWVNFATGIEQMLSSPNVTGSLLGIRMLSNGDVIVCGSDGVTSAVITSRFRRSDGISVWTNSEPVDSIDGTTVLFDNLGSSYIWTHLSSASFPEKLVKRDANGAVQFTRQNFIPSVDFGALTWGPTGQLEFIGIGSSSSELARAQIDPATGNSGAVVRLTIGDFSPVGAQFPGDGQAYLMLRRRNPSTTQYTNVGVLSINFASNTIAWEHNRNINATADSSQCLYRPIGGSIYYFGYDLQTTFLTRLNASNGAVVQTMQWPTESGFGQPGEFTNSGSYIYAWRHKDFYPADAEVAKYTQRDSNKPITFSVTAGLYLGGNLNSLGESDNSYLTILCDEFETNGQLLIDYSIPHFPVAAATLQFESKTSRTDILEFIDSFNWNTSSYAVIHSSVVPIVDRTFMQIIPAPDSSIRSSDGRLSIRARWIPSLDVDGFDGWTYSVDQSVVLSESL